MAYQDMTSEFDYKDLITWTNLDNLAENDASFLAGGIDGPVYPNLGTAGAPAYTFKGDLNTGIYSSGADALDFSTGGTKRLGITTAAVVGVVPISLALGAVGTPSYTFTGDLDTGIYSSAANVLDFATQGVNRISIGATGIIVINEDGADADFRIEGDTVTGLFLVDASADMVSIDSLHVGGTSDPGVDNLLVDGTLQVTGACTFTAGIIFGAGAAATPSITFDGDTNTGFYSTGVSGTIGITFDGTARFYWSGSSPSVICAMDILEGESNNHNIGSASQYWNDISYKTLTDRGCLGSFDDGVELSDGRVVSDNESLLAIQPRRDGRKTIYGAPMLDYRTFPKVSYKKAWTKEHGFFERDENDDPIGAADGIEMTSMQSIMIGAQRESYKKIVALEEEVKSLKTALAKLKK